MKKSTLFFMPILALSLMTGCVNNTPKTYTVTWLNSDGSTLEFDKNVKDGEMPRYDGETPTREAEGDKAYYFKAWSRELAPVHSNQVYIAVYEELICDVLIKIKIPNDATDLSFGLTYDSDYARVDWGDGSFRSNSDHTSNGETVNNYERPGNYCIRVYSDVPGGVTSIGVKDNKNANFVKELYLGKNITSIGDRAFQDCSSLSLVQFFNDKTFTSIGAHAFQGCSSLTSIDLPESLTAISEYTFFEAGLKSISLPNKVTEIGKYAFSTCKELTSVNLGRVAAIHTHAFEICKKIPLIVIPSSVKYMENDIFMWCSVDYGGRLVIYCENESQPSGWNSNWNSENCPCYWKFLNKEIVDNDFECVVSKTAVFLSKYLGNEKEVTLPTTLADGTPITMVGANAFIDNKTITDVTIPDSYTAIDKAAFENCSALKSIKLPVNLKKISSFLFYQCKSLDNIDIPEHVTEIGGTAFQGCPFTSIELPDGLVSIDKWTFAICPNLTALTIPDSVKFIGEYAFRNDIFEEIDLPLGLEAISEGLFENCASLKTVTMDNNVKTIGWSAFNGCNNLNEINFSENLEEIGGKSFVYTKSLKSIKFPKSLTYVGDDAFKDSSLNEVDLTDFKDLDADLIPTAGNNSFPSGVTFHVISQDMANIFAKAKKGWPEDIARYTW